MDNGQHEEDTMDAETVEAIADAHEALMRAWSLLDGEEGGDPDDAVADAMEAVDAAAVAIAPHCGRPIPGFP